MTLQGSLNELPLSDVIQLIAVSGKTGVFELSHEGATGRIFLRDGRIVHATTEGLEGEEAVYQLVTWSGGSFLFEPGRETDSTTIQKANDNLLIEAAKRHDEWGALSKKIESTQLVPVLRPSAGPLPGLSAEQWALVCAIDGRRTIEEIALAVGSETVEAGRALLELLRLQRLTLQSDPLRGYRKRLSSMSSEQFRRLLEAFDGAARKALARDPELDRNLSLCRLELRSGREIDALCDLVRGHACRLVGSLGEEVQAAFFVDIEAILSRELA